MYYNRSRRERKPRRPFLSDRTKYRLIVMVSVCAFGVFGVFIYGYATGDWRIPRFVKSIPARVFGKRQQTVRSSKPTVSFAKDYPFNSNTSVIITGTDADVQIVHGSDATANVEVWYSGDTTANERFNTSVSVGQSDTLHVDVYPIETYTPDALGRARIIVTVPRFKMVDANIDNGGISLENLAGNINVSTSRGSIHATNVSGQLALLTQLGEVTLERCKAECTAETKGGQVRTSFYTGKLWALASGDITLRNHYGATNCLSRQGSIVADFMDLSPACDFVADSGNITLRLLPGTRVLFDLRSPLGSITNELALDSIPLADVTDRTRLTTTMNGGGAKISAHCLTGTIALLKYGKEDKP